MQTPEKGQFGGSQLFKMFSLRGQNPPNTPVALLLSDNKPPLQRIPEDQPRTAQPVRGRKARPVSDENQEVVEELADFKRYLHKSTILEPQKPQGRLAERTGTKGESIQRQAMKDRLQRKIQQAQEKLEQIKSTLRKYQKEKSEIVKNSDIRRSSIHSRPPTAPQPSAQ